MSLTTSQANETRLLRVAAAALCLSAASIGARARAQADVPKGDVFDQFHRFADSEHKTLFEGMPGESVDPFTGTLRIVQVDLALPGKAGLDLAIVRAYGSRIWGRSDLLDMEPLLAEKEHSVLGYGWTFHMGRLRNPNAIPPALGCGGDFPVYEAPDGSSRVFYPVEGSASVFRSKDYWRLERDCTVLPDGASGACIWSDTGVRYEFLGDYDNQYFVGTVPVLPVSRIVDRFGNRILATYVPQTGAVATVTDTYDRTILFDYVDVNGTPVTSRPGDGLLYLDKMRANGNVYQYGYTTYGAAQGLPGSRRFLTAVTPPAGPPFSYEYGVSRTVAQNRYALSAIGYPAGGRTEYTYDSVAFFTGRETVPFSVVRHRKVTGRGVTVGDWSYAYRSPGPPPADRAPSPTDDAETRSAYCRDFCHVTTITRPDGNEETYWIMGFGWVHGWNNYTPYRATFAVGLTLQISRGGGAEVEGFSWDGAQMPYLSPAPYNAPVYSGNCGPYNVWDDHVYVPVLAMRQLWRDGGSVTEANGVVRDVDSRYTTTFSDFDAYAQPWTVTETGDQYTGALSRTTKWTYLAAPADGAAMLNLVRGSPLTQQVCIGETCVANSWSYDPDFHFALESETRSGVTTTFDYHRDMTDGPGNLATVTNALGKTLRLSEYAAGWGTPRKVDFAGALSLTRETRWEGWVESATDKRGYTTRWEYDAIGRLKTLTPPSPSELTTYTYEPDGSKMTIVRGSYSEERNLDGLGRATSTSNSEGVLTSQLFDAMGRAWFASYPGDAETGEVGDKLEFDALGRVLTRTRAYRPATSRCDVPGACEVENQYFANCVLTKVERSYDPVTEVADAPTTWRCNTSFGDPGEGFLTLVMDAAGGDWRYGYTVAGKLESVTAPLAKGNRTWGYDERQFLTSESSGDTGPIAYVPDAMGQMTSRSDGRPVTATYGRVDPLGRVRTITFERGSDDDVTLDYDDGNNLKYVASANGGAFDLVYDAFNRVTSQAWTYGGRKFVTSYHYDGPGCLDTMTYPSGLVLSMTCDSMNRVKTITLADGSRIVTDVVYHATGQIKDVAYGNGKSTSVVYDDRGRVDTLTSPGVLALDYGYDGADNATSFVNGAVANSQRTMMYDDLDRLLTSIAPYQWGSTVYDYDALGNRFLKSIGSYTTTYVYDDQNRLASLSGGSQAPAAMSFTWDLPGRLASSSDGASYRYDGRGRRVRKSNASGTILYHYDDGGRVIAETLADGTKLRDFIYLGGKLAAVDGCVSTDAPPCSERQWYHTDTLGTPLARTNAVGAVVGRFDHEAWGERWATTSAGATGDRTYNGRVLDAGTGFHDYGARMYWPEIGRFVSPDSSAGSPAEPMSLNRYSYVRNNPYKYIDPSGRWGVEVHRDHTRQWALEAGLTENQAILVALADNGTDSVSGGRGYLPVVGDPSYHFDTNPSGTDSRMERFNSGFANAVRLGRIAAEHRSRVGKNVVGPLRYDRDAEFAALFEGYAMEALGQALHALQDIEAHSDGYVVSQYGIMHHLDNLLFGLLSGGGGDVTDNWQVRRAAHENTHRATVKAVSEYRKAVGNGPQ